MFSRDADRFWERVDKTGECWLWTRSRTSGGYGMLTFGGKQVYAHRFSYLLAHGEWPKTTDHLCHNPPCVRPEHLESVTHQINVWRGLKPDGTAAVYRLQCPKGHLYAEDNTYIQNGNERICRQCMRDRSLIASRKYREANREAINARRMARRALYGRTDWQPKRVAHA